VLCFNGRGAGDALLKGRSERAWIVVGREKFWRLLVEELACDWAYRGRGGGGGVGAFCRGTALPIAAAMTKVEGRGLLMVRGVSSSSEEDSTLRRAGRDDDAVDADACAAAALTIGEKLPGALPCGVPVVFPGDCDMVAGL
jgi:hypothetical protein